MKFAQYVGIVAVSSLALALSAPAFAKDKTGSGGVIKGDATGAAVGAVLPGVSVNTGAVVGAVSGGVKVKVKVKKRKKVKLK